ncbi:DUF397 domain-containing protein [Sphaerisporangium corydalis]|uniref:DUF397 domain-containing protein n=1 Tax=Sphaerisporangium corydalis TaxID=1441875 RepID=A0ABV9ES32_9ACTN|nr:DUF397 domain-containing protein [Sphaerisporangium corydalis]
MKDDVIQKCDAQPRWRRSSFSGDDGSNCVEVAHLAGGRRAVRDSKDRGGSVIICTPAEWTAFLDTVRTGRSA